MGQVSPPSVTLAQIQALMPQPATMTPVGVQDAGVTGSGSKYAREDHTHASKARKQIRAISATGLFTWTFPVAFVAGVVPICNAIAICPSGTTALVNVQQEGDATNTQVTFRVTVYQQSIASLLSLTVLSLSTTVPANTKLSLLALEP